MSSVAVRVENLSKMYRLGVINNKFLYKDIQTWIAVKRKKEDPHSKIGEDKYRGDKDHFWALKDISFDIKKGDRVGIIGKNGAGKSTLLKILSRITAPTEGNVKIKGKVASLLEVGTGFHGELTGRENIYLNGAILGMKKRRIDKKLDDIIAFSGIEHHIDTPVKRYSSGMYVRLAFAVAAHLDSDILIADEVLAVGDADFQKKALGKMQDLSTDQGRTVFFVSHNLGSVKNLCNTGIVLEAGRIISYDAINNSIEKYIGPKVLLKNKSNSAYISELSANLEARIVAESGIGIFKPFAVEVTLSSRIKTENISIHVAIGNDEIDNICCVASAETDNIKLNIAVGINKYTCYFPSLPLVAGAYRLRIAIVNPFCHIYYNNKEFLYFDIPEDIPDKGQVATLPVYHGLTYIPHKWSF
ncbi:MAG: ABC transporter ATP-binding protein [Treponema sp.]|nr:ABC transporter ATP-binding protein [Treponema sp.]